MGGPELPPAAVAAAGHHGHAQHPSHQQGEGHHDHECRHRRARGEERSTAPSAAIKAGRGTKVRIEDYTPQAEVVYRVIESGMSLGSTVVVLNQWRRRSTLEPVSYGCLQRFVRSSAVIVLEKCETIKSGSKDEGTTWAWARYQFAQQLKRQFRKGARIAARMQEHAPALPPNAPCFHGGIRGPLEARGRRGGGP